MRPVLLALLVHLTAVRKASAQITNDCSNPCYVAIESQVSAPPCSTDVACQCGYLQQVINCIPTVCTDLTDQNEAIAFYSAACANVPGVTLTTPALAGVTTTQAQPATTQSTPIQSTTLFSDAGAGSIASIQSISSELGAQTRTGGDPNAITTATVLPSDPRIKYDPTSSWINTSSQSGVGSCNNGTKATQDPTAKFTFVFEGTDISLYIVPSSKGGAFSVQIDGDQASSLSGLKAGGAAADQCIPSQIFTKNNMPDQPHEIVVSNGGGTQGESAGTLEFNSIIYTGKGAFGSSVSPAFRRSVVSLPCGVVSLVGAVLLLLS